jgi:catechol 2,3-dioxygenase-like lactoylglutathione lyase family enzyme
VAIEYDGALSIAVNVSDLPSAIEWYEGALGFAVEGRADAIGWAELATPYPGVTLGLSEVESDPRVGGITPTFGVRDLDAARAHLEGRGIRFDGDATSTRAWSGWPRSSTLTATRSCSRRTSRRPDS